MKKKRGVVLTCKVGALMPMRKPRPASARRTFRFGKFLCKGGPYAGRVIKLDAESDLKSLTIKVRGQVGRYFGENWIPS
jgi:hypothetical protein